MSEYEWHVTDMGPGGDGTSVEKSEQAAAEEVRTLLVQGSVDVEVMRQPAGSAEKIWRIHTGVEEVTE